jgi:PAS domain S-box-containing protein
MGRDIPSGLLALKKIVEGTSASTGQEFFEQLVKNLAEILNVHGVWVTEYLPDQHRLRAFAFWLANGFVPEYEYDVEGTPCEPVVQNQGICHIPDKVIQLFPKDPDLPPLGAVSYMGLALRDADGRTLGHLAMLDNKKMVEIPEAFAIFRIFAARAEAELRRVRSERALRDNEQKLDRLLNGTTESIFELDENLRLVQANQAALKTFGLNARSFRNLRLIDLFTRDSASKVLKSVQLLKESRAYPLSNWVQGRQMAITGAGKEFPVEVHFSKYQYDQRPYFAVFIRNRQEVEQAREQIRKLDLETLQLRERIKADYFEDIIGNSQAIQEATGLVEQVAPTDSTVLIHGETGTGKELFARAIHKRSRRHEQQLISINCAALPPDVIESELFGHEKGAFTGASSSRKGKFLLADKGTLFLDEIGELPLQLQAKLLRVIQEGEFDPVGSSSPVRVDVRIIAATNRDLARESAEGRFREDLYYRLNVFPIRVPPLRERKDDVILLTNAFIEKFARKTGRKFASLQSDSVNAMLQYNWPGNVRELQNLVERALIVSNDGFIDLSGILQNLSHASHKQGDSSPDGNPLILTDEEIRKLEKENLIKALKQAGWRVSGRNGAAALIGVPATTLYSRMQKYGIGKSLPL